MDRLQVLTHGTVKDRLKLKYETGKAARQSKTKMDIERFNREAKRLKNMDAADELEERTIIVPGIEDL